MRDFTELIRVSSLHIATISHARIIWLGVLIVEIVMHQTIQLQRPLP